MDVKKSYKADLDNQRAAGFLLGLVVVLSLFLAALEFTTSGDMPEADSGILDDVAHDIEMAPLPRQEDMTEATTDGKPATATDKVNIVDQLKNETESGAPMADVNRVADLLGVGIGDVTDIQATTSRPLTDLKNDNPLHFQVVERLPEFPGGMSAFVQWLSQNLRYPATAQRNKKQGTVTVSFIINTDGTTTAHKVMKSAGTELDREALRVVKLMPKWKPGEDHGAPCRTYFCIPIVFKL